MCHCWFWKKNTPCMDIFLLLLSTSHIFLAPTTLIQIWQLWWQCNWWLDIIWSPSPSVPSCKLLVSAKDEKIVRKSFPMYEWMNTILDCWSVARGMLLLFGVWSRLLIHFYLEPRGDSSVAVFFDSLIWQLQLVHRAMLGLIQLLEDHGRAEG